MNDTVIFSIPSYIPFVADQHDTIIAVAAQAAAAATAAGANVASTSKSAESIKLAIPNLCVNCACK